MSALPGNQFRIHLIKKLVEHYERMLTSGLGRDPGYQLRMVIGEDVAPDNAGDIIAMTFGNLVRVVPPNSDSRDYTLFLDADAYAKRALTPNTVSLGDLVWRRYGHYEAVSTGRERTDELHMRVVSINSNFPQLGADGSKYRQHFRTLVGELPFSMAPLIAAMADALGPEEFPSYKTDMSWYRLTITGPLAADYMEYHNALLSEYEEVGRFDVELYRNPEKDRDSRVATVRLIPAEHVVSGNTFRLMMQVLHLDPK